MRWRLAWGLSVCVAIACGGRTDLGDTIDPDGGTVDASADAKPKKDSGPIVVDAGYQPLGKKCSPPTGAAPPPWTPDDAGAPVRPPVVMSSGGPVLANPVFVPITFDGDDMRAPIEDFIDSVGCTSYWQTIVRDYGVNDAYMSAVGHIASKAPMSIDDTQIATFIRSKILSKDLPYPTPNTLYVIFYPDGTDITLQGQQSCQAFGGYHNEFGLNSTTSVAYAVIPRCGGFGQLAGIDEITATTSHELVEAVTDPLPMSNPAYQLPEPSGIAWALAGGGEIGDMCEFNQDAFYTPSDYPFAVQRQWVNHAAFALHDPCRPSDTTYFAAAPVLPDTITYNIGLGAQTAPGIGLSIGQQKTINVHLISDGTWNAPIFVDVQDAGYFFGSKPALNFNVSPKQGNVGDTITITVTRIGTNQMYGIEPFAITATSQGISRTWWALVGDP